MAGDPTLPDNPWGSADAQMMRDYLARKNYVNSYEGQMARQDYILATNTHVSGSASGPNGWVVAAHNDVKQMREQDKAVSDANNAKKAQFDAYWQAKTDAARGTPEYDKVWEERLKARKTLENFENAERSDHARESGGSHRPYASSAVDKTMAATGASFSDVPAKEPNAQAKGKETKSEPVAKDGEKKDVTFPGSGKDVGGLAKKTSVQPTSMSFGGNGQYSNGMMSAMFGQGVGGNGGYSMPPIFALMSGGINGLPQNLQHVSAQLAQINQQLGGFGFTNITSGRAGAGSIPGAGAGLYRGV